MNWLNNICYLSDSYKVSHYKQLPPNTKKMYSYFESRTGAAYDSTVFFGLQYWLKEYLCGQVVTQEKIDRAEKRFNLHFGKNIFNKKGWQHILEKHDGYLPIEIKAVPEGTAVDGSNVLMTAENTDEESAWLTNYLETMLVQVWYPSTVTTQSRAMKSVLLKYLNETGDPSLIDFKLHDFGFRGVTCPEQAAIGGAAHLVNFLGTDTFPGIILAEEFYDEEMAGFSIPASEHSTITSWGRDNEVQACENILTQYPDGLVACVSDSFDIFKCCSDIWGGVLKDKVLKRDGTLVVRPDSGHPPFIVVQVLNILGEKFGYTINKKGYKVLNPKVRVIQGDGIDFNMLGMILDAMKTSRWSADNVAFGSGGGLLQKLNRDTQKFAFKCSSILVLDENRDVYKQPITDKGKKSKSGRFKLVKEGNKFLTVGQDDPRQDELQTVFLNGKLLIDQKFSDIRKRAKI
ncbi:MAG: nicotinate phosphoribosyltransferase [Neisseriaceae bacterium]|nr:MAG: nicotinate phosphoribosyltransferase [Neisseriaceae bacterium]